MTIHKSKGLEFDRVILPGLDQIVASNASDLLLWQEWLNDQQNSQLLISPVHGSGKERDSIYDFIRTQQKNKQALEADRLLYVGCTRAIKHLYLFGCISSNEAAPKNHSMLASLWPHIKETARQIPTDAFKAEENNPGKHPNKIIRSLHHETLPKSKSSGLLDAYRAKAPKHTEENNRAPKDDLLQRHHRYFGTVMHLALQQVTESGYRQWNADKLKKMQRLWSQQLLQYGMAIAQAQQRSKAIVDIILAMLANETGRWLLDNSHSHSACELSLWSTTGKSKEFVIDRTFVEAATGTRWIIDYKSSTPVHGQSLEQFVQEEEILYRNQLSRYADLFSSEEHHIKTALYFPNLLHLHPVNVR